MVLKIASIIAVVLLAIGALIYSVATNRKMKEEEQRQQEKENWFE